MRILFAEDERDLNHIITKKSFEIYYKGKIEKTDGELHVVFLTNTKCRYKIS